MYVHCCQNCQPLLLTRPLNWWFRPSRYITITTSLYIYFESWPMMTMFSTWQYEVKMEDVEAAEMVISMRLVVVQCQVWQQCTLRHQSPSTSGHQLNLSPAIQLCNTWTCDMTRHMLCVTYHTICLTVSNSIMSQLTAAALQHPTCVLCLPGAIHLGRGKSANLPIFWLDISSRRRLRLAQ